MEYEVIWGDGPLGLTLRPDLGEDMPPVVGRITKVNSTAASAHVAVGHMLVSVNGQDTARKGYDHTVEMLQTVAKPARLRFRIPLVSARPRREKRSVKRQPVGSSKDDYTIIWTEGPLGIILRPDDFDCHIPSIRKITGKGSASGIDQAGIGDRLIGVNGQETKAIGFRATISLLRTIQKPVVLLFRPSRLLEVVRHPARSSSNSVENSHGSTDYGVYDIIWKEGQLGLTLKPDPDSAKETPIISRLTGKGSSGGLHNAVVGDELISVNGYSIEADSYQDVLRRLKDATKPAVLRFRPVPWTREIKRTSSSSHRSGTSVSDSLKSDSSGRYIPHSLQRGSHDSHGGSIYERNGYTRSMSPQEGITHFKISNGVNGNDASSKLHKLQSKTFLLSQDHTGKRVVEDGNSQNHHGDGLMLAKALEQIHQTKEYEKLLAAQNSKNMIIANAVGDKPPELLGIQKSLMKELSKKLPEIHNDEAKIEEQIALHKKNKPKPKEGERWNVINELHSVLGLPALGEERYCADCLVPESESELEPDENGEYYCMVCWEKFYEAEDSGLNQEIKEDSYTEADIVDELSSKYKVNPFSKETDDVDRVSEKIAVDNSLSTLESTPRIASATTAPPVGAVRRQRSKQDVEVVLQEEVSARLEAEKKLKELQAMRLLGDVKVGGSQRVSAKKKHDREERQRRGNEELSRALEEEAARARAKGNENLARKLAAQAKREGEVLERKRLSNDELAKSLEIEEARLLKLELQRLGNESDPISPCSTGGEDDDEDENRTEELFAQVERARALALEAAAARQEAEEESRILADKEKTTRARVLVDYANLEKEKEEDLKSAKAEEEAYAIAQAKYKAETEAWQLEASRALAEAEEDVRLQQKKYYQEDKLRMREKSKEIEERVLAEQEAKWRENQASEDEYKQKAREKAKLLATARNAAIMNEEKKEKKLQRQAAEQALMKAEVDENYLARARAELDSLDSENLLIQPNANAIAHVRAQMEKFDPKEDGYLVDDYDGDSNLNGMEDHDFELNKQVEEAHEVVARARETSLLNGRLTPDSPVGLSTEQINLFKKLTSQAEDRASIVNSFHPLDVSDSEEESMFGEGSELDVTDEKQDPDGVWI